MSGRDLLIAGVVIGGVGYLVVPTLIGICAPRPVLPSNEAGAIGDSRSVNSAEVAYASSNDGAFGLLSCLGTPTSCGFLSGTTAFIDSNIVSLQVKQGYARSFVVGARGSGKPDAGVVSFVYVATPVTVGETGNRGFAIDSTGLLCFTTNGSAPPIVNAVLAPTCNQLK